MQHKTFRNASIALTHAGHYQKLSNLWYSTFVNAELKAIVDNLNSVKSPYGDGTDAASAPIIALGESWAYHIGCYMTDKRYGANSSDAGLQNQTYSNGYISGLNSYLVSLENFDPNLSTVIDPFHWIPSGLYYDLLDVRIETRPPVNDNVNGYTNQQFFNAFSSSITTLSAYKTNLLNQNANSQSAQVTSLFSEYHY